jgi:alpha-beta hydrolase superfamily lysophospholipase
VASSGHARFCFFLLLLLPVAACAPRLQPLGPDNVAPALTADALVMDDGVALPLRVWPPREGEPAAVILALHGFNDYSRSFEAPAAYWAGRGIVTYAYDQRGFGQSPHRGLWAGDERMIADLRTALRLVAARHPGTPLYLLGESMGGAGAAAAWTADPPPAVDGIILVAPAVWGRETQGPLQSALLWLAAHSVPWMTLTGEGLDILPSDNFAMLRALGRDPLVIKETRIDAIYGLVGMMDAGWDAAPRLHGPALLLYGAREEVIPEDAALDWLRRLPPQAEDPGESGPGNRLRVAVYPDGYHMLLRDLHALAVWNDIAQWIADRNAGRSAALPSGAEALAAALIAGDAEDFTAARTGGAAEGEVPANTPAAPAEGAAGAIPGAILDQ